MRLEASAQGPFPVRVDRRKLTLVLDNVLANAALHAPEGSLATARIEGGALVVENPCGPIAEADVARLFEPFFRPDPSRSAGSGGTGLGLYLAKSSLDALGVPCAVEATGGTFRFTADLRPIAAAAPPAAAQTES